MKEYKFYGWQTADVPAVNEEYKTIKNPRHLYDLLSEIGVPIRALLGLG